MIIFLFPVGIVRRILRDQDQENLVQDEVIKSCCQIRPIVFIPTVVVIAIMIVACLVFGQTMSQHRWERYKMEHQKVYHSPQEEAKCRARVESWQKKIDQHNKEADEGKHPYKMDINQYSDELPPRSYRNLFNHSRYDPKNFKSVVYPDKSYWTNMNMTLPTDLNWTSIGAVTAVKNQGHCHSCWIFAAVGALEGQYFMQANHTLVFSEQKLVDCLRTTFLQLHCLQGGWPHAALDDVVQRGGIPLARDYPYTGKDQMCNRSIPNWNLAFKQVAFMAELEPDVLVRILFKVGPVAVSIDALGSNFAHYKSGVYFQQNCDKQGFDSLSHSLLLVGYGHDQVTGLDYWLLKNSWGVGWGEHGYVRIARNMGNNCGLTTVVTWPVLN